MSIGGFIADAFQGHLRIGFRVDGKLLAWGENGAAGSNRWIISAVAEAIENRFAVTGYDNDGINGTPRVAAETRPASMSAYVCIKY
jgi:hypothetical protein